MKPLNQKERNNLFFQFLVFYVVSIIVVLFAAFGNIQMNQKQNVKLKADIDRLNSEMRSSEDFFIQMNKIESIISDVKTSDSKINLQASFDTEKRRLGDIAYKDSARASRLGWNNIITGYDNRWKDKSDITDNKDFQTQLQSVMTDRDKWKEKYEDMKDERDKLLYRPQ